ncbi:MAG: hypothetical protein QF927_09120, partial [Verrucomicrobiota bacterium]|nr:hypothetical protein [Verrucomicrobiota bacterium]
MAITTSSSINVKASRLTFLLTKETSYTKGSFMATGKPRAPKKGHRNFTLQPNKKPLVPSPPLFIPLKWLSFLHHKSTINFALGTIPAINHKLISTALAHIKTNPTGEFSSPILIAGHTTQTAEGVTPVHGQDSVEL